MKKPFIPIPCSVKATLLESQNGCTICKNCDTQIHDLTQNTDAEIEAFRVDNPEACVRVQDTSMDVLMDHVNIARLRNFILATVMVFGTQLYVNANEIESRLLEQYSVLIDDSVKHEGVFVLYDHRKYKRIKKVGNAKLVWIDDKTGEETELHDFYIDSEGMFHFDTAQFEKGELGHVLRIEVEGYMFYFLYSKELSALKGKKLYLDSKKWMRKKYKNVRIGKF